MKDYAPDLASDLLDTPNNLLGLEYLKALKRLHSTIHPHTISGRKRLPRHYHCPEKNLPRQRYPGHPDKSQGNFTDNILQQLPFS